ncbi:secreted RxLR effector protein 161-like [Nicotiana tomentosiformis]|uniref:secreted RxLR effector protein 161-like n=1 Tax=Nicotiana tomentosiformis TaxID=4098 RepID=UPI00388CD8AE
MNDMIITGNNEDEVARLQDELSIRFDINKFGLKQSKTYSTPLEISTRLRRDEGSLLVDPKHFLALVGSLLYLTITRPYIAFSVGYVSRFMQRPRKPHLEVVKRNLKYINSTSYMGLFFQKKNCLVLAGYIDVDFGGDLNDRRSTLGYIVICGGTSVSWCSNKQDSVSLSTTEAEYKVDALCHDPTGGS